MIVDIYTRQSGDETEVSPELQESICRQYAKAQGWEVDEVVVESATSSQLSADERGLGDLVRKCERGESDGILCRYLSRFGRNVGHGALAYDRIRKSGARLVAVGDGLDSSRDGSLFQFTVLTAVAQQEYDRNRQYFLDGKARKASQGVWCSAVPFGYEKDADGRLVPNDDADTVRLIFKLRIEGKRFSEIAARDDVPVSRSGVRKITMNRAYLGEQRIANPASRQDAPLEPLVFTDDHQPLITPGEFNEANAVVTGRAPVHTGLKDMAALRGIVRCGLCEAKMTVSAYGNGKATYACTNGCGKASMALHLVEPAVLAMLDEALESGEPHVAAVMQGDNRYADALEAVEQAQRDHAEYRDSIELQRELGVAAFAEGLKVRKAAIQEARRVLRETPRPFEQRMTREEFMALDARLYYPRLIADVLVFPRTAEHRLMMRWQGQAESERFPVEPVAQVDVGKLLAA